MAHGAFQRSSRNQLNSLLQANIRCRVANSRILNGESYRLKQSKARRRCATQPAAEAAPAAHPETGEITTAS